MKRYLALFFAIAWVNCQGQAPKVPGFTQPAPLDFNDHTGYISLFNQKDLGKWDGNQKFWRVENGIIVGESTKKNPSGNAYLVYRGMKARDFTLKLEIKVEGDGGSGIQYRSLIGRPWTGGVSPEVLANIGSLNLDWMMTGPQADFWPVAPYWSGQFYSENNPMHIMAWRGQVVEAFGGSSKRLMGNIGNIMDLAKYIRKDGWNEYTIIARGGVFIHILNGQLMSVLVDDDRHSLNNQNGYIGIELEGIAKVSVRNIWLKKLN